MPLDGYTTGIVMCAIFGTVAIVNTIVNGVVKTKQAEHQLQREYLAQMMAEIQEIKTRLGQLDHAMNEPQDARR